MYADGNLSINFAWLNETKEEESFRGRLAEELKTVPVFASKIKEADGYVVFTIAEWGPQVERLIAVMQKMISI